MPTAALTAAERDAKIADALLNIEKARRLFAEVSGDFSANAYRIPWSEDGEADRLQWQALANLQTRLWIAMRAFYLGGYEEVLAGLTGFDTVTPGTAAS